MGKLSLDHLNPQQKKAVESTEGRLLVLAGAGSGKTSVLTLRMVHLVRNKGVSPSSLLGLTFTNKAAAEMRHRCASLMGQEAAKQVTLSTFHSFCLQILRKHISRLGYTTAFSIYDQQDILRLATLIARDILGAEGKLPSVSGSLAQIDRARSQGMGPDDLEPTGQRWYDDFLSQLYRRLIESMRVYNAVDFDDMLLLTIRLFEQHPDVLEQYHDRYRYVMIDEYQDTNPVQARLAQMLAEKHGNLCVVGDDDQSIYGWRGAQVRNILDFAHSKVVKLEQNYRSTSVILDAANAVIANNDERHNKKLWSGNGAGVPIEVFVSDDEVREAEAVVYKMDMLRKVHKLEWDEMAVLYRSNALARQVEQALLKYTWQRGDEWVRGVPYQVFGGTSFYERKEVKDLLAYLRIIVNGVDEEAILRVINQPRRGIGETSLGKLTDLSRQGGTSLWAALKKAAAGEIDVSSKAAGGIKRFVEIIEQARDRLESAGPAATLEWLIQEVDYRKAIEDEVQSKTMRAFKWDNVQQMVDALAEYQTETAEPRLEEFVASLTLDLRQREDSKERKGRCVSLMTFHSAKGLEFPACFMVGVEDHIIPHEISLKESGLEEERRLMYVAITRAKKWLTISMARRRCRLGKPMPSKPSRFLVEIPPELLKVARG